MSIERANVWFVFCGIVFLTVPHCIFTCSSPPKEISNEAELLAANTERNDIRTEFNDVPEQNAEQELAGDLNAEDKGSGPVLGTRSWNWGWGPGSHEGSTNGSAKNDDETDEAATDSISISATGTHIQLNANGVHATAFSSSPQNVEIVDNRVLVNGDTVSQDTRKLKPESSFQKQRDGSMWFTNLSVGQPMTDAEKQKFLVEEASLRTKKVVAQRAYKEGEDIQAVKNQAMELAGGLFKKWGWF